MNFLEIAKKRYSVRSYSGKKVEQEKLDKILLAAHVAPTAANMQPVKQATELGLGSVWICYFKPDVIQKEFDLPDTLEPVNILAVGYSDESPADPERHATQRVPLSDLVYYEKL